MPDSGTRGAPSLVVDDPTQLPPGVVGVDGVDQIQIAEQDLADIAQIAAGLPQDEAAILTQPERIGGIDRVASHISIQVHAPCIRDGVTR